MPKTRFALLVPLLSIGFLFGPLTLASAQEPVMSGLDSDTVTVKFLHDSITVSFVEDSITIVVFNEPDAFGPITLFARYESGGFYRATQAKGIPPGEVGVARIPYHPFPLTIGRSRQFDVGSGDVVVVHYPRDYQLAGWLRPLSP